MTTKSKTPRLLVRNGTPQSMIFLGDGDASLEFPPGESEHNSSDIDSVRSILEAHPQVTIRELAA